MYSHFFPQLVFLQKVINKHPTEKATKKVIITKGMTSSKSTSSGGSSSATVSGEVGFKVMKIFDVKIGASGTLEHNWSLSTTRTEFQQVTSEISIGVKPEDEVSVFQVVGECKNSDGTVYTVKTPTYVIKGKGGSSETKKADFSEAEKKLSYKKTLSFNQIKSSYDANFLIFVYLFTHILLVSSLCMEKCVSRHS